MKRYLLISAFIFAGITSTTAQTFVSISPNNGVRGTSIQTTVTASGFFFTMGSAPSTWGDFYMQQGGTTILPTIVNVINNDQLNATWNIPSNAPVGNYD